MFEKPLNEAASAEPFSTTTAEFWKAPWGGIERRTEPGRGKQGASMAAAVAAAMQRVGGGKSTLKVSKAFSDAPW